MLNPKRMVCSICGEQKRAGQAGFLVLEDAWLDRLKILRWNHRLAAHPRVHFLCTPTHVGELVAHWMATGTVTYPLLSAGNLARKQDLMEHLESPETPAISSEGLIGELAVHRESLERALRDHPESLSSILNALLSALEYAAPSAEGAKQREEVLTAV